MSKALIRGRAQSRLSSFSHSVVELMSSVEHENIRIPELKRK